MMGSATWAYPLPNREVFYLWVLEAANPAKLAAWEECPHLNQGLMLPLSLVFELATELSPRAVSYCLGKMMILHHAGDVEALHTYDIVLLL